jgi:hypothetical protein
LDFDRKVFGETSSKHTIKKFRKAKQIIILKVFPLKYYPSEKYIRAYLTECGRRFLSMIDIYFCEYKSKAFYIEEGQVIEIFIKSQVVIDMVYFREKNPNYTRPSIKEPDKGPGYIIDLDKISEKLLSPAKSSKSNGIDPSEVKGNNLFIYSLIIPGFSLGDKR